MYSDECGLGEYLHTMQQLLNEVSSSFLKPWLLAKLKLYGIVLAKNADVVYFFSAQATFLRQFHKW